MDNETAAAVADGQSQSAVKLAQVAAHVEELGIERDAAFVDMLRLQLKCGQLTNNFSLKCGQLTDNCSELRTQCGTAVMHLDAARAVYMASSTERDIVQGEVENLRRRTEGFAQVRRDLEHTNSLLRCQVHQLNRLRGTWYRERHHIEACVLFSVRFATRLMVRDV